MTASLDLKIGGILETNHLSMFSVLSAPHQPGIAGKILSFLGDHEVSVEFLTLSSNLEDTADVVCCFRDQYNEKVRALSTELQETVGARGVRWRHAISVVGIYGPHFKEKPYIAGRFCSALGQYHINIIGISSSISSVSCIIDTSEVERAKEAILQVFELP